MIDQQEFDHLYGWPNAAGFQVEAEQRDPVELRVTGKFPAAVAGTLLRTGPSSYKVDGFQLSHWFDGFSQVYRFQLLPQPDGFCKVVYNSRRQVDRKLEECRKTGRLEGISFGQKRDPCVSFFGKLKTLLLSPRNSGIPDDVNVGVTIHEPEWDDERGILRLRTDSAQLKTIDASTLEPVGVTNQSKLHPDLSGPLSCAHAQFDPKTGDCFNYNLAFGRFATYRLFRTDAKTGETEILATITGADVPPSYVHSFFLTENFVVLCIWPACFAAMGMATLWERNFLDAMNPFDPNASSHWFVVDRRHGKGLLKRFKSPAMFAFHTVNAYEEQQKDGTIDVVADLTEYPTLDILHRLYYDNLVSNSAGAHHFASTKRQESTKPSFSRFKLRGISSSEPSPPAEEYDDATRILHVPSPRAGELPTMNSKYRTKPYRFVYGLCDRGLSSFSDGIIKLNIDRQETLYWSKDKHTPGEAIFVADPKRESKEDGGWILSCILDGEKGTSYLLCLDAETLKEVGRAESDVAWGLGFHGTHTRRV